jgi:hypothetical protein
LQLAVVEGENTFKGQLLARILMKLGQPKWRIGKKQSAIGAIHQVVGTVQALALVTVR